MDISIWEGEEMKLSEKRKHVALARIELQIMLYHLTHWNLSMFALWASSVALNRSSQLQVA